MPIEVGEEIKGLFVGHGRWMPDGTPASGTLWTALIQPFDKKRTGRMAAEGPR